MRTVPKKAHLRLTLDSPWRWNRPVHRGVDRAAAIRSLLPRRFTSFCERFQNIVETWGDLHEGSIQREKQNNWENLYERSRLSEKEEEKKVMLIQLNSLWAERKSDVRLQFSVVEIVGLILLITSSFAALCVSTVEKKENTEVEIIGLILLMKSSFVRKHSRWFSVCVAIRCATCLWPLLVRVRLGYINDAATYVSDVWKKLRPRSWRKPKIRCSRLPIRTQNRDEAHFRASYFCWKFDIPHRFKGRSHTGELTSARTSLGWQSFHVNLTICEYHRFGQPIENWNVQRATCARMTKRHTRATLHRKLAADESFSMAVCICLPQTEVNK